MINKRDASFQKSRPNKSRKTEKNIPFVMTNDILHFLLRSFRDPEKKEKLSHLVDDSLLCLSSPRRAAAAVGGAGRTAAVWPMGTELREATRMTM